MLRTYQESSHKFVDSVILNDYLMAGNAVVTLDSPTGVHHSYLYAKPKNQGTFPEDVRFVYSVGENHAPFYLGMIELDKFRLTRNSRFSSDTDIVKGAFYIERLRKNQKLLSSTQMTIYHVGLCGKCGRKLTDPKSIELGLGPRCAKRLGCQ